MHEKISYILGMLSLLIFYLAFAVVKFLEN